MPIYAAPKQLGLAPVAILVPVFIESAWAWYDPDFFTALWLEADEEARVIQLNNWWSDLEITGRITMDPQSMAWAQLDGTISQWVAWKKQYNDATVRRWFPGGRDWDDELQVWFAKFTEMSALAAKAGGIEAERRIAAAGIDPRLLTVDQDLADQARAVISESMSAAEDALERAGKRTGKGIGAGLMWPAIAVAASMGLLVWLATRESPKRGAR